ncbi:hypothetical protein [Moorena producens]|uniref:hypothetical protein n=1 Tax=Moorena producens TaxID=1155739 RepID=UPI003C70D678
MGKWGNGEIKFMASRNLQNWSKNCYFNGSDVFKMLITPLFSQLDSKQWICVLDPALALSYYGVHIAQQLGEIMELWIARELWHILNNTKFYLQQPELLIPKSTLNEKASEQEKATLESVIWSLKEWKGLQTENDLLGLNLFWLGDSLKESLLPKGTTTKLLPQWEYLARLLDRRINQSQGTNDTLMASFRDTVALTASLGSAFILSYQNPTDFSDNRPPDICKALDNLGISCQLVSPQDRIVALESDYLRQLMIYTGLAKLLWEGLHLCVIHLVTPAVTASDRMSKGSWSDNVACDPEDLGNFPELKGDLWINAKAFWYKL